MPSEAVKERPIIFSGWEVRAILAGIKTQTRRLVKHVNPAYMEAHARNRENDGHWGQFCPLGREGDRLWVRETWNFYDATEDQRSRHEGPAGTPTNDNEARLLDYWRKRIAYRADGEPDVVNPMPWRPSTHMPRWASRITLEVELVRVQRVQDISYADILAEGWDARSSEPVTDGTAGEDARAWFAALWDSIHGPGAWERNDWVWAVTFRRVKP